MVWGVVFKPPTERSRISLVDVPLCHRSEPVGGELKSRTKFLRCAPAVTWAWTNPSCTDFTLVWKLYTILNIPKVNNEWPGLTWQQCLLGSKLPRRLEKAATIWSLLRGSVIWYCWLDRNAICFVNENWLPMKMEHLIWEALLDHARTAWYRTNWMIEQQPRKATSSLATFGKVWMQSACNCIGFRQGSHVTGNLTKPPGGCISWV
jgi:hypothetical protein